VWIFVVILLITICCVLITFLITSSKGKVVLCLAILLLTSAFVIKIMMIDQPSHAKNIAHNEYMLWSSPGYSKERQLNFSKFTIKATGDHIYVVFTILNESNKTILIEKETLDLALVKPTTSNNKGFTQTIWQWHHDTDLKYKKNEELYLKPQNTFREEIIIDRNEIVSHEATYYINAYYKNELVAQYKVLEGLTK